MKDPRSGARGAVRALIAVAAFAALGLFVGCSPRSSTPSNPSPVAHTDALHGAVYGGRQPIVGATVIAYAAATTAGAVATEIGSAVTDTHGTFTMTFSPAPATGEVIYATASGGDAGDGANSAIGLMTVAGVQGSTLAPAAGTVNIDELSTVASTAALKQDIQFVDCATIANNTQSGTCMDIPGATDLTHMAATVNNLVNVVTGQASDFLAANAQTAGSPLRATLTKLDTLASILAACVNAAGPGASPCANLFQATGGQSDLLMSAWLIARMPAVNAKAQALYVLTPGSPVFAPTLATVPATTSAGFWTVGGERYAWVANRDSNNVSGYGIGRAGGGLASVPGSPFTAGVFPQSVALDPTGRYAYVANEEYNSVSAYTIDSTTGALTPIAGSPFAAGGGPASVAVDPTGRYVYVANDGGNNVSAYTIGSGGALTPIAGSPFAAGTNPESVAVDPAGRTVYVANIGDNDISAYTIDSTTGALTPIAGSPFAAGGGPESVTVDPTGRTVYVANSGGNNVSAYTIESGGALTAVGAAVPTGTDPRLIIIGP